MREMSRPGDAATSVTHAGLACSAASLAYCFRASGSVRLAFPAPIEGIKPHQATGPLSKWESSS
jgi:hypothetical protein